MPIQGPVQFGTTEYQVESLKICSEAQMGAEITEIMVLAERDGLADLIALNEDVHGGSGCVAIDRTQAGNGNYSVRLTIGGGSGAWMYLFGVESTWEPMPS